MHTQLASSPYVNSHSADTLRRDACTEFQYAPPASAVEQIDQLQARAKVEHFDPQRLRYPVSQKLQLINAISQCLCQSVLPDWQALLLQLLQGLSSFALAGADLRITPAQSGLSERQFQLLATPKGTAGAEPRVERNTNPDCIVQHWQLDTPGGQAKETQTTIEQTTIELRLTLENPEDKHALQQYCQHLQPVLKTLFTLALQREHNLAITQLARHCEQQQQQLWLLIDELRRPLASNQPQPQHHPLCQLLFPRSRHAGHKRQAGQLQGFLHFPDDQEWLLQQLRSLKPQQSCYRQVMLAGQHYHLQLTHLGANRYQWLQQHQQYLLQLTPLDLTSVSQTHQQVCSRWIAEHYQLSEAIARVGYWFAAGHSAEQCAQLTGLSTHTVYSYIKTLYHTLGVNRQPALTALLWQHLPAENLTL